MWRASSPPSRAIIVLFAEVLRSRVQQTQPALVAELHRQACRWYEQHHLFEEAVTHALAVPEVEHAARLIEQHGWSANFPSQFQMLLGWLDRLPDVFVRSQPSLCIIHAVMLMLSHQLERAAARIQDAERCLEEEMPADQRCTILRVIAASRGTPARLLGDYERGVPLAQQALDLLPEMEETLLRRMIYPTTLLTAASAYLVDGDLTPATERLVEATVASMRDLHPLPTTLRRMANLARLQLLQGMLRQAASTIEQLPHLASGHRELQALLNGADYYFLLGELLRALALEAQGDSAEALTTLGHVLVLAEPEGYIRLFLDEGRAMVALLQQAHKRKIALGGYIATLLEVSGETTAMALDPSSLHSSPLLEALTVREREVLRLLLTGASNREIAHHLVLSVNTVKKHIWNIYGKLGVQSRAQAMVTARTLNLL